LYYKRREVDSVARPVDPNAQYRVKPHINGGRTYASTQPPYIDQITGKKKYRYIHWGAVDENYKFIPGIQFFQASPEERARLIFPEEWDMSEAKKITGLRPPGRPTYDGDDQNRFYGDIWLLEQIAMKTGVRQDLESVFNGNREIVDDILTLAMFPYLTKFNYSRVARWQKIAAAPSSRELTPKAITLLTSVHYRAAPHGSSKAPGSKIGEGRALCRRFHEQIRVRMEPCRHPLGQEQGTPSV